MIWILDASVAVKWFVAEEHVDKAFEILEDILNDPTKYAVPELFFFELNHVICRVLGSYSKEHKQLLDILANIARELVEPFTATFDLSKSSIENTYKKVAELKKMIHNSGSKALIEIDGGVNKDNAKPLIDAGADVLVAGNFVFSSDNPKEVIERLKSLG